jgi:hypothetical protein
MQEMSETRKSPVQSHNLVAKVEFEHSFDRQD